MVRQAAPGTGSYQCAYGGSCPFDAMRQHFLAHSDSTCSISTASQ